MMTRVYEVAPRLLMSFGVALLLCSLLLVPTGPLLADDPGGGDPRYCEPACQTDYNKCQTPSPFQCKLADQLPICPRPPGMQCYGCSCEWDLARGRCWCWGTPPPPP